MDRKRWFFHLEMRYSCISGNFDPEHDDKPDGSSSILVLRQTSEPRVCRYMIITPLRLLFRGDHTKM